MIGAGSPAPIIYVCLEFFTAMSQRREALTYIVSSGFLALFPFVFGMAW